MKNSKFKYELKKQFDDLIYEIVKTRTLNYSDDINQLIKQMTPTIEKINNLLEEKTKWELNKVLNLLMHFMILLITKLI